MSTPGSASANYGAIAAVLIVCFLDLAVSCPGRSIPLNGVTVGGSERGAYLGFDLHLAPRDLAEIGVQFVDANVGNIDIGLSVPAPIYIKGSGLRLAYTRFLSGSVNQSGLFAQAALAVADLGASASVDLSDASYLLGGATSVTCRGCGRLRASLGPPVVSMIPSVGLGWQSRIRKNLLLRGMLGIQYYKVPSVEWTSSRPLPAFATTAIDDAVSDINREISSYGNFYPTASLSLTYAF